MAALRPPKRPPGAPSLHRQPAGCDARAVLAGNEIKAEVKIHHTWCPASTSCCSSRSALLHASSYSVPKSSYRRCCPATEITPWTSGARDRRGPGPRLLARRCASEIEAAAKPFIGPRPCELVEGEPLGPWVRYLNAGPVRDLEPGAGLHLAVA